MLFLFLYSSVSIFDLNFCFSLRYNCILTIFFFQVNDFVCISDSAYVKDQILAMEKAILGKLGWYLTVPTPYVFLVRYIKASLPDNEEVKNTNLT